MDAIDRLIAAVKASGYKQTRVAADARMPAAKLSKILNRKQEPTVAEFVAIAGAIQVDPGRLFAEGELVVELGAVREAYAASNRLSELLASMLPAAAPLHGVATLQKEPRSRSARPVQAAANPNAELVVELESERRTIPRQAWNRGARIIARVVGDSMDGGPEPLRDGDLAFLKPTRSRRNVINKTALIRCEDGLYLKIFEMSGHTIRLVSANPASAPIELDARGGENLEVYGYVVASGR